MKSLIACLLLMTFCLTGWTQTILDECFDTVDPSPSFDGSSEISNFDADLVEWDGSQWIGQWPNAQIDVSPYTDNTGCRAMWVGNATSWTTGGEGFGLKLEQPLVQGQDYAINFLYVSDGNGGDGVFAPTIMSNDIQAMIGAYSIGSLPAAGYNWITNTFEFTATAEQDGDIWLIVSSSPEASSGLIGSWCEDCGNDQGSCEFELGDDLTICEGDSALIEAEVLGVSFLWQDGSSDSELYASAPGTYWVQASSNKCSHTDSIEVFLFESSFSAGPDFAICPNDTTFLEAEGGVSYEWSQGLGTDALVEISPEETTTYVLTGTDTNGCVQIDSITVTVHPEIPVSIAGLEEGTYCLEDLEVQLTGEPANGDFQGPGVAGDVFNPAVAGVGMHTITYTFEDQFGCKHETLNEVSIEICDFLISQNFEVEIFPIPASNHVSVKWDSGAISALKLTLFDSRGRELGVPMEQHDDRMRIDVSSLANGVYHLRVARNAGAASYPLLISR